MSEVIKRLSIEGFKSIRKLEDFELRSLNIMIGANGAGKSNFVGFFRLLREMIEQRLQLAIATEGGADACLFMGPKLTREIAAKIDFGHNAYEFALRPTVDNHLVFAHERVFSERPIAIRHKLGSGHDEAKLKGNARKYDGPHYVFEAISNCVAYHFHDTSVTGACQRFWDTPKHNLVSFIF